jgi:N-acetylglucosaminyldiphosphoundecaprenol N-acetyl-beta-D-mannosaminyltransferase
MNESLSAQRIRLFELNIDAVCMNYAIARILAWAEDDSESPCRFVVTPNVDHTVMLREHEELRRVYRDAHLVLADGFPIVLASKLVKKPLPERVAGSELVPDLFAAIPRGSSLRVFLLGAAPGVADRAAEVIHQRWPRVQVVGTYSPPLGFENDPHEEQQTLDRLKSASPQVIVVGLGAPKQELWVHKHHQHMPGRVALCVGATIDFIAGEKAQAPVWMRRVGLEWFHRVATEPRRLAKRYAKDAWVFPQLVWREWNLRST